MSYRKGQAGAVIEGLIFFSIEGSRFRVLYSTVAYFIEAPPEGAVS